MEASLAQGMGSRSESELSEFLNLLGASSPLKGRVFLDKFIVSDLNAYSEEVFDSEGRPVLLGCQVEGRVHPLCIFFIEKQTYKFGHANLLLDTYEAQADVRGILEKAIQDFFRLPEETLIGALNPDWLSLQMKGVVDKRPLWNQFLSAEFCPKIDASLLEAMPSFPVLSSVYHFNNPYLKHLLEVSIPKLQEGQRVLVMGCGAGFEAVVFARKTKAVVDAVDINPMAVLNTQMTALRAGLDRRIHVWRSDLFSEVYERYDLIYFNPPLAVDEGSQVDPNRFDVGGKILERTLDSASLYLNPQGSLILMSHPRIDRFVKSGIRAEKKIEFLAGIPKAIHEIQVEA